MSFTVPAVRLVNEYSNDGQPSRQQKVPCNIYTNAESFGTCSRL